MMAIDHTYPNKLKTKTKNPQSSFSQQHLPTFDYYRKDSHLGYAGCLAQRPKISWLLVSSRNDVLSVC